MDHNISQQTHIILENLYEIYNLDQATFKLTQELSQKYCSSLINKPNEHQLTIITRMALWLASKQQQIAAIDGSIVHGSGITLNSVIIECQSKGITSFDELIDIGITMVNDFKIDQGCQRTLQLLKLVIQNLQMFYKKLEGCLQAFNFGEQQQVIKGICWFLFLIIKKQLSIQDVVQSTCILISVLNIVFTQLIHVYQPNIKQLQDIKQKYSQEQEQLSQQILQYLMIQFKFKDLELFTSTNQQTKSIYQDLIKQSIIKQLKTNYGYTLFVGSIINANQYKLDQHYKCILRNDDFDERIIIPERSKHMTPKKVTPKIKQISNNIKQQQINQKQENVREYQPNSKYQKLLNYEVDQKINMNTNLREIRLPKNILMSPYAQQQIIATPMTEAMEMYNWIHDKQIPFKKLIKSGNLRLSQLKDTNISQLQQLLSSKHLQIIDTLFHDMIEYCEQCQLIEQSQSKKNLYWTLYLLILEKQQDSSINENYLKGLLGFIIECVNFVMNKTSKIIEQLILKCQIHYFEVWKSLDFFLNQFDSKIPLQLKEHYLDLETKYVSYNIWASDSQSELITFLNEIQVNRYNQNNTLMNRLFNRVLHYCAYQISTICSNLKISEQNSEYVWITVKYIVSEKTETMRHHSLDQIVLASIYAVVKVSGQQIKFQSIINSYESTNSWFSKQFIKKIVCNVYINSEAMGDIVTYYNQVFIPQIKNFMLKMSQEIRANPIPSSPFNNKNPAIQNKVLDSPLRDVLPRNYNQQHGLMTPSTQLLYAYQESPLLKQPQSRVPAGLMKENINSNMSHTTFNQNQKYDYNSETQEFIMKKFEQLKNNKSQITQQQQRQTSKPSFSILAQGTPKIINSSRNNSSLKLANQSNLQNASNYSQTEGNSTFCKLLNFES